MPSARPGPRIVIDLDDTTEVLPVPAPSPPTLLPAPGSPALPPPPAPPPPSAGEPWWQSRRGLYAAAGLFAVLAVAGVIGVVALRGQDQAKEDAGSLLRSTQVLTARASERAGDAGKLRSIQASARASRKDVAALRAKTADLATIDDTDVRKAAEQMIQAQITYVQALTRLERIGRRAIVATGIPAWETAAGAMQDGERDIARGNTKLKTLEIPGAVLVDVKSLEAHREALDERIKRKGKTRRNFLIARNKWREKNKDAQARADKFNAGYVASVNRILGDYENDRKAVDAFVPQVDEVDAADVAARFERFKRERQRTIEELSAAAPSAELYPSLVTAHNGLLAPVQQSLEGLDSAQQAALSADAFFDDDEDEPVTDQPAWADFETTSADVSSAYGAAKGTWQGAANAEAQDLAKRGIGSPPKEPNL